MLGEKVAWHGARLPLYSRPRRHHARITIPVQNPVLHLDKAEPLESPKNVYFNVLTKHRLLFSIYEPHIVRELPVTSLTVQDFAERLETLRDAARESDFTVQDEAVESFGDFLAEAHVSIRPRLTLRPHGEVRALWEDENSTQVGITFGLNENLQYVLFTGRKSNVSHHYGMANAEEICRIIDALDLSSLIRSKP